MSETHFKEQTPSPFLPQEKTTKEIFRSSIFRQTLRGFYCLPLDISVLDVIFKCASSEIQTS